MKNTKIKLSVASVSKFKPDIIIDEPIGVIKPENIKYPIGGYAPGHYVCLCVTCKTEFIGDKRAVQCESCAVEMVNRINKVEIINSFTNLNDERKVEYYGKQLIESKPRVYRSQILDLIHSEITEEEKEDTIKKMNKQIENEH